MSDVLRFRTWGEDDRVLFERHFERLENAYNRGVKDGRKIGADEAHEAKAKAVLKSAEP